MAVDINRDPEWGRDEDWERRYGRMYPGYRYSPERDYDWWGNRPSIPYPSYGYDRDYDWERRGYTGGTYTGRGPRGYQRADDRIYDDICDRLTQHPNVDASDVDVEVKNGEVTLKGTVDNRWEKRQAEDIAEGVSGVKEVHNQLRVTRGQQAGQQGGQTQTAQARKAS